MTHIVVGKRRENVKPHSICFLPQYQRQRKCFSFRARGRARAENGVCTLIDKGKLSNQIARLVAIVVKIQTVEESWSIMFCSYHSRYK